MNFQQNVFGKTKARIAMTVLQGKERAKTVHWYATTFGAGFHMKRVKYGGAGHDDVFL